MRLVGWPEKYNGEDGLLPIDLQDIDLHASPEELRALIIFLENAVEELTQAKIKNRPLNVGLDFCDDKPDSATGIWVNVVHYAVIDEINEPMTPDENMSTTESPKNVLPADPSSWSEKSKQSIPFQFGWIKEYADIAYQCWRCRKATVFSAADQKFTYEVKKAYIDQKRILCSDCWMQSEGIANDIRQCEQRWDNQKNSLKNDPIFLSKWLSLLILREQYIPYKPNTAIKNMLQNLLKKFL